MKKLILILLCLPLFIFSQEEIKYERTMSVSQFAEELKQAGDKGDDYTLEDCEIALSVNEFSTLGFGQIPVRGFTKYVAIIEGFIGWFMLSVFIVSLLSQMMSV